MWFFMQSFLKAFLLVCMVIMQTGCGFQLRSSHHIPESLKEVRFSSHEQYSELSRLVRKNMRYHKINLNPDTSHAATSVRITNDTLERSTLSLFQNGTIAEYELTYTVTYTVNRPKASAQKKSIIIHRQYTDDLSSSLAKSSEVRQINTEMRQQAAERILYQLIALHTEPQDNKAD